MFVDQDGSAFNSDDDQLGDFDFPLHSDDAAQAFRDSVIDSAEDYADDMRLREIVFDAYVDQLLYEECENTFKITVAELQRWLNATLVPHEVLIEAARLWQIPLKKMFVTAWVLHSSCSSNDMSLIASSVLRKDVSATEIDRWINEVLDKTPQQRRSREHLRFNFFDVNVSKNVTCIIDGVPVYCQGDTSFYNMKNKAATVNFQCICTLEGRPIAWSNWFHGTAHDSLAAHKWIPFEWHNKKEIILADTAYIANRHCLTPEKIPARNTRIEQKTRQLFEDQQEEVHLAKQQLKDESDDDEILALREALAVTRDKWKQQIKCIIKAETEKSSKLEMAIRIPRARIEHVFSRLHRHRFKQLTSRQPVFIDAMINFAFHLEALKFDMSPQVTRPYTEHLRRRTDFDEVGPTAPRCECDMQKLNIEFTAAERILNEDEVYIIAERTKMMETAALRPVAMTKGSAHAKKKTMVCEGIERAVKASPTKQNSQETIKKNFLSMKSENKKLIHANNIDRQNGITVKEQNDGGNLRAARIARHHARQNQLREEREMNVLQEQRGDFDDDVYIKEEGDKDEQSVALFRKLNRKALQRKKILKQKRKKERKAAKKKRK